MRRRYQSAGRCDDCCFWNSRDGISGTCRRLAPRARDEYTGQALWPFTAAGDGCGEYEPRVDPSEARTAA